MHAFALPSLVVTWAGFYQDSKAAQVAVQFAHIGGLLVGGGVAVASDRATLLVPRGEVATRVRRLEELRGVHTTVLTALAVVVASGVLFFLSDLDTFLPSVPFWSKMGLVALLLGNGAVMLRTERALRADPASDRAWRRLRWNATVSLVLWLSIVLLGTVLANT